MKKYIFDQSNGLWYELQGDYYIPCLVLDETGTSPIGMWGRKHQQYLKEHRPVLYFDLVLSGKLHSCLADIDTQARNKLHLLITQLAEKEGINEQLKAAGPDGMGRCHEQHPKSGGRNHPPRADLWGGCRMRLLEEFWYGNIEPTEYDTNSCKEYKEVLRLITRNEEKLLATITDAQKELFSRYADAVREHQTMAECLLFQNSFKLGARIMLEVMEE